MKKHKKLFLVAFAIVFFGYISTYAPTSIGQPPDSSRFIYLCVIAAIVFVIGIVKYIKSKIKKD